CKERELDLFLRGDLNHHTVGGIGDINRSIRIQTNSMRTSQSFDAIEKFPFLDDVDGSVVHITHIDRVVGSNYGAAARRKRPILDELSILVEDGNPLVVAVADDKAAFGIDHDAVRQLKFA